MNRLLLTLALGMVCAAAVLTGVDANKGQQATSGTSPRQTLASHRTSGGPTSPSAADFATSGSDPRSTAAQIAALRSAALTSAIENFPSRVELDRRAALVEEEANQELRRLVPLLGLATDQEERVFKALVRSSPNFSPGMLVGGQELAAASTNPTTAAATTTTAAANQVPAALFPELTAAQVDAYLQDANARDAWWQEYLAKVASKLKTEIPVPGFSTTPVATAPVEVSPTGEILPAKESRAPTNEE